MTKPVKRCERAPIECHYQCDCDACPFVVPRRKMLPAPQDQPLPPWSWQGAH